MKKKLDLELAIKVAQIDCEVGILSAMEELHKNGFNCKWYFKKMNKYEDVDEDNMNIKSRDKMYKKLGIYETMQEAYEIVWG